MEKTGKMEMGSGIFFGIKSVCGFLFGILVHIFGLAFVYYETKLTMVTISNTGCFEPTPEQAQLSLYSNWNLDNGGSYCSVALAPEYWLDFELEGEMSRLSVNADQFKRLAVGDRVKLRYVRTPLGIQAELA